MNRRDLCVFALLVSLYVGVTAAACLEVSNAGGWESAIQAQLTANGDVCLQPATYTGDCTNLFLSSGGNVSVVGVEGLTQIVCDPNNTLVPFVTADTGATLVLANFSIEIDHAFVHGLNNNDITLEGIQVTAPTGTRVENAFVDLIMSHTLTIQSVSVGGFTTYQLIHTDGNPTNVVIDDSHFHDMASPALITLASAGGSFTLTNTIFTSLNVSDVGYGYAFDPVGVFSAAGAMYADNVTFSMPRVQPAGVLLWPYKNGFLNEIHINDHICPVPCADQIAISMQQGGTLTNLHVTRGTLATLVHFYSSGVDVSGVVVSGSFQDPIQTLFSIVADGHYSFDDVTVVNRQFIEASLPVAVEAAAMYATLELSRWHVYNTDFLSSSFVSATNNVSADAWVVKESGGTPNLFVCTTCGELNVTNMVMTSASLDSLTSVPAGTKVYVNNFTATDSAAEGMWCADEEAAIHAENVYIAQTEGFGQTSSLSGSFNLTNATYTESTDHVFSFSGSTLVGFTRVSVTMATLSTRLLVFSGSGLTLSHCEFSGMSSFGAIELRSGASGVLIDFCSFDGMGAATGAAVGVGNGVVGVVISESTFTNNRASGTNGGAITMFSPGLIRNCLFSGNSAASSGGGLNCVQNGDVTVTVDGCTFTSNTASLGGGGLAAGATAWVSVKDSTFGGNSAATGGGISLIGASADVIIRTSVFTTNVGAVSALVASRLYIYNSFFLENAGPAVQAIDLNDVFVMVNCTVVGNSALASSAITITTTTSEINNTFVYATTAGGSGFRCSGSSVGLYDSVVCGNEGGDVVCAPGCVVNGLASCSRTVADCAAECIDTDFCVPAQPYALGPYGGCYACGGDCLTGETDCVNNSVCIDDASVVPEEYFCVCDVGFSGIGDSDCDDVNECANGTLNTCSPLANCSNTFGSFTCNCKDGYTGDGVTCVDVNECADGSHTCAVNGSTCTNLVPGYDCACVKDWFGSGEVCAECPPNTETDGADKLTAAACTCSTGFYVTNPAKPASVFGCVPCGPGFYLYLSTCVPCPANTWSNGTGVSSCNACPARSVSPIQSANISACVCEGDFYSSTGESGVECLRYCPPGTQQPPGGAECVNCAKGRYSTQPNSLQCTSCPANTDTAASGASALVNCTCDEGFKPADPELLLPAGTCVRDCPLGFARPSALGTDCNKCGIGSYASVANLEECITCPANTLTRDTGAVDVKECVCKKGYFSPSGKAGVGCVFCPDGAVCLGGTRQPFPAKGYAELEEGGLFAQCAPRDACKRGGECADGYTGQLCAQCDLDYYRLDQRCRECSGSPGGVVFAVLLLVLVVCCSLVWFNSHDRTVNKFAAFVIGFNSLQIAAMYGRLDVNWPYVAEALFDVLSVVNFNVEILSPECAVRVSNPFLLRWSFTMLLPVYLLLNFLFIYAVGFVLVKYGGPVFQDKFEWWAAVEEWLGERGGGARRPADNLLHTCQRAYYQIITLIYLPLVAAAFEFFMCTRNADETYVFVSSPGEVCYNKTYWGLLPLAILTLVGYGAGIPFFYAYLLKFKRASLGEFKFMVRYGFLVGRFKTEQNLYELVIMGRKFGVVFCMSVLSRSTLIRASGAIIVLVAALFTHGRYQPYLTQVHNGLEAACLLCAILILLLSMGFEGVPPDDPGKSGFIVFMILVNILIVVAAIVRDAWLLYNEETFEETAIDDIDEKDFGDGVSPGVAKEMATEDIDAHNHEMQPPTPVFQSQIASAPDNVSFILVDGDGEAVNTHIESDYVDWDPECTPGGSGSVKDNKDLNVPRVRYAGDGEGVEMKRISDGSSGSVSVVSVSPSTSANEVSPLTGAVRGRPMSARYDRDANPVFNHGHKGLVTHASPLPRMLNAKTKPAPRQEGEKSTTSSDEITTKAHRKDIVARNEGENGVLVGAHESKGSRGSGRSGRSHRSSSGSGSGSGSEEGLNQSEIST